MVLVNQSVTTLIMLFPVKADFFGVLQFAVKKIDLLAVVTQLKNLSLLLNERVLRAVVFSLEMFYKCLIPETSNGKLSICRRWLDLESEKRQREHEACIQLRI